MLVHGLHSTLFCLWGRASGWLSEQEVTRLMTLVTVAIAPGSHSGGGRVKKMKLHGNRWSTGLYEVIPWWIFLATFPPGGTQAQGFTHTHTRTPTHYYSTKCSGGWKTRSAGELYNVLVCDADCASFSSKDTFFWWHLMTKPVGQGLLLTLKYVTLKNAAFPDYARLEMTLHFFLKVMMLLIWSPGRESETWKSSSSYKF